MWRHGHKKQVGEGELVIKEVFSIQLWSLVAFSSWVLFLYLQTCIYMADLGSRSGGKWPQQ